MKFVHGVAALLSTVVSVVGGFLAVEFNKASLLQAVLAVPLAIIATTAGALALIMLIDDRTEESFEFSSNWGGLGGGLGGWRLSRPLSLAIVMLIAVAALASVMSPRTGTAGHSNGAGTNGAPQK